MALTGIGENGYLMLQKETTYNTPATDAMELLPWKEGSVKATVAQIENNNVIGCRLKQEPDKGRIAITGELTFNQHPDILGLLLDLFLGAATDTGTSTTGYTHTWLAPLSGAKVDRSFTIRQAFGDDLAKQFSGCRITAITLASDNEGNQTITLTLFGKSYLNDQTRPTTFTCSNKRAYSFGMSKLFIQAETGSERAVKMNSYELTIDLGYNTEDYKLGSLEVDDIQFNAIPTVTFGCNIDAEDIFLKDAQLQTKYKLRLETNIGTPPIEGVSGVNYSTIIELPRGILSADTEIPFSVERETMDLSFDCAYGGQTTGSGATKTMFEIRHKDGEASYNS
ncbi:hypothetical protein NO1_1687 [Candidatus Termititenax aidoneus]|uniref:Phage tail protein n=1 Tax=Termititenax aidoneus TaxID=2218524 RepID=A0A388TCE6_TERA1|nr:hypothetical protein NO1_1687 [Candidatus Termititenax aidoneus]